MNTNEPMTQKQLDAIRERVDAATTLRRAMPGDWQRLAHHLSEDVDTLTAEVKRLQAMVKGLAQAWEEGHSWGWANAQDYIDAESPLDLGDRLTYALRTPNPYERGQS